jgi:hypothetical protein
MPIRDEDNSNQKDGSFNPLPGDDSLQRLYCYGFCVAQHKSGARNDSVTVYNKTYQDNAI